MPKLLRESNTMTDKTENCWPENWPLTAVEEIENREEIIEAQAAEIERLEVEKREAMELLQRARAG